MKIPPVPDEGSLVFGQFDPLPEGEHNACVAGFRIVKTKGGDFAMVVDFVEIMAPDSPNKPRSNAMWISWDNNANMPADHWGRHKWRSLVRACNRDPDEETETNDLIGEPVGITVQRFGGKPIVSKVFSLTTTERIDGKEFWEEFSAQS